MPRKYTELSSAAGADSLAVVHSIALKISGKFLGVFKKLLNRA